MFDSIEEYGLDKLGEEGVDKGGGCCIVQHGFKSKGRFGGLVEHDVIKICLVSERHRPR